MKNGFRVYDADTHVSRAAAYRGGQRHVGVGFLAVALDLGSINAVLAQMMVDQHARAGAVLAVDESNVRSLQIAEGLDVLGIALFDDKPQMAPEEID